MKEVCMEVQSTTPSYNRIQNFERFSQRSPFSRYPLPLFDGMGHRFSDSFSTSLLNLKSIFNLNVKILKVYFAGHTSLIIQDYMAHSIKKWNWVTWERRTLAKPFKILDSVVWRSCRLSFHTNFFHTTFL